MLLLQGIAESLKQISNPVVTTCKDIIIAFNGTTGDTQMWDGKKPLVACGRVVRNLLL